jgi:hypothetical protein
MKKISLFVVTAAAVALVLSGCSRGPGTDDMEMMPSLDGTWVFDGFQAIIDGTAVEVTVGNGVDPLPTANPAYAVVTQIVAKGNLAVEGTGYKLTLADDDDAITVTLSDAVPEAQRPVAQIAAKAAIQTLIMEAQDGDVMITVDEDTITVMGSFLDTLWELLELGVPEAGLTGCKAPCMMAP